MRKEERKNLREKIDCIRILYNLINLFYRDHNDTCDKNEFTRNLLFTN